MLTDESQELNDIVGHYTSLLLCKLYKHFKPIAFDSALILMALLFNIYDFDNRLAIICFIFYFSHNFSTHPVY